MSEDIWRRHPIGPSWDHDGQATCSNCGHYVFSLHPYYLRALLDVFRVMEYKGVVVSVSVSPAGTARQLIRFHAGAIRVVAAGVVLGEEGYVRGIVSTEHLKRVIGKQNS